MGVGKKSYECLFSMVYTVDRVDPRKSRAKCKGIKKGAVKQVTVTSPNGFSFTMDMKFSAKGVAMAKITVEASSSSSGSGGSSITGGSGRPPTGGSGSGPVGGSGNNTGGSATTAPGGDDEVVTRVKSYIDSGTCARVSSSSSCGDSAESYFQEFVYQGRRIVVSNQVPDHPHEHDQVFTNPNEACERY